MSYRQRSIQEREQEARSARRLAQVVFAVVASGLVMALLGWGFSPRASSLYISQLNDGGYQGGIIMAAIMLVVAVTAYAAALRQRFAGAGFRVMLLVALLGMQATTATSTIHKELFYLGLGLAFLITIATAVEVLAGWSRGWGVVLLALIVGFGCLLAKWGPVGQKIVVLGFVAIEAVGLYLHPSAAVAGRVPVPSARAARRHRFPQPVLAAQSALHPMTHANPSRQSTRIPCARSRMPSPFSSSWSACWRPAKERPTSIR